MKKILITGANSYIGTSFEKWLQQWPNEYYIETVDMIDESWKNKDFSGFDVVFHVAGIAHIRETSENANLYYKVNRDLAVETAHKAKLEGVPQFIILSSMSVYGLQTGIIDNDTLLNPKTNYGKSKLQADIEISKLADSNFLVTILRPPMVYGKGCKGNYQTLAKYAIKLPFFPDIKNQRSMVYINNLTEYVRQCIENKKVGVLFPQNSEYICTSEMVKLIAETHGKRIKLTKLFNPIFRIMRLSIFDKVFGNLVYVKDKDSSYDVCDFRDSIFNIEK